MTSDRLDLLAVIAFLLTAIFAIVVAVASEILRAWLRHDTPETHGTLAKDDGAPETNSWMNGS